MISGVPRTKIYGTLRKLLERGLIVEVPGRPVRFSPASPAKALHAYLQHLKEKTSSEVVALAEVTMLVSFLEEAFRRAQVGGKARRVDIWIIQEEGEVLEMLREMLTRAKERVEAITSGDGLIHLYRTANKLLDSLAERGVRIELVAPATPTTKPLIRELSYVCRVRLRDVQGSILLILVDSREFLLARLGSCSQTSRWLGVFSSDQGMCSLLRAFVFGLVGRARSGASRSRPPLQREG